MTRVALLPHRSSEEGVRADRWTVFVDGVEQPRSTVLAGWDRRRPIDMRSEIAVDLERLRRACGLSDADAVSFIATWHASTTNIRAVAVHFPVDSSAVYPTGFVVDPRLVGGRLTVVRAIVLSQPGSSGDPLAAHRPGAVLWREGRGQTMTIALDQDIGRLSTEAIDFRHLPEADPKAAWQLEADLGDLHAAPSRALQLFVNAAHPTIDRLLSEDEDEESQLAQSVLRWDVARQLVDRSLDDDAFVRGFGEFESDSVGGAMQRFFERWLAGVAPSELQELRLKHPSRFEALLQARLHLLRNP